MNLKWILSALLSMVVLAGCVSAPQAKRQEMEKAAAIPFTFDWPDGLVMNVEMERHQTVTSNGNTQQWDGKSNFQIVVERTEEGVMVRPGNFAFQGEQRVPFPEVLNRAVNTGLPRLAVSLAGDLERSEGTMEVVEAYANAAQVDISKLTPEQRTQVQAVLDQMLAPGAADLWGNLVAFWANRELKVGAPHRKYNQVPIPLLNAAVNVLLDYSLVSFVDCEGGEPLPAPAAGQPAPTSECVRVELNSQPDPEELEKLIAAQTPAEGQPELVTLENDVDVVLVTEPKGLLPHKFRKRQEVKLGLRAPDGSQQEQSQVDEAILTFSYPGPGAAPPPVMPAPAQAEPEGAAEPEGPAEPEGAEEPEGANEDTTTVIE